MKTFRTHYLIDKDFQLKYAFLLASIAVIVALLIGGLLFYSLKSSYQILLTAGLTERPEVLALITYWKKFLSTTLLVILGFLILFLTLLGILITHKMVGPIFVLKRKLQEVSEGTCTSPMNLRARDEFQDVKDKFNHMLLSLQARSKEDIATLENVLSQLKDPQGIQKTTQILKNLISKKQKIL
ncbi:MAG: hypothetical protein HYY62_04635 [Deltaproteobacteria bacterium]|nr:hypothetical protein [Deltaproteobacteria bacterium]